jgi:hypothetical protein
VHMRDGEVLSEEVVGVSIERGADPRSAAMGRPASGVNPALVLA